MSSFDVVIVDEDYGTREFVESFTEERDAHKRAEGLREQMAEDGESFSLRVEVVPGP